MLLRLRNLAPLSRALLRTSCSSRCQFRIATSQFPLATRNLCSSSSASSQQAAAPLRSRGKSETFEFQAETRQLLDIVARSLYSDRHVFIREFVSNASDALEKLRHFQLTAQSGSADAAAAPAIRIDTDEQANTISFSDTGIGLTRAEAIDNLGIIAKSGSQQFIAEAAAGSGADASQIIGKFGVGFYSAFMVADEISVFSRSCKGEGDSDHSEGILWRSDGLGQFQISAAENVPVGTKIVLKLKSDAAEFSRAERVKQIVQQYSSFVSAPIFVNGEQVNTEQPLWLSEPSQVSEEQHSQFYKSITGSYDNPRYTINYKTEAPLSMRALLYIPDGKPALWDMSRDSDVGVSLYSRRVQILSKAQALLPRWLRFLKGVVDSEDVPLNLSRELLQNNRLIAKLNEILTSRVIRFLTEQAKKDADKYAQFCADFGLYIKEGVVTTQDQSDREKIADLLRFESSTQQPGSCTSLTDYLSRNSSSDKILFLSSPSRQLAESSPYLEAVANKQPEVLYLYEPYDELVLMQLGQFKGKRLQSVENELAAGDGDSGDGDKVSDAGDGDASVRELANFMTSALAGKVKQVKLTNKLTHHACVVSIKDLGAVRHLLRTAMADRSSEERMQMMQSVLEINSQHELIKHLARMRDTDPQLTRMFAEQLCDNALVIAGVLDDPRLMIDRLNELLTAAAAAAAAAGKNLSK